MEMNFILPHISFSTLWGRKSGLPHFDFKLDLWKIPFIPYFSRMKYSQILKLPSRKPVLGYTRTIHMLKRLQSSQRFPRSHCALRQAGHSRHGTAQLWGRGRKLHSPSPSTGDCPKEQPNLSPLLQSFLLPLKPTRRGQGAQIQYPSPYLNDAERGLTPRNIITFSFKSIRLSPPLITLLLNLGQQSLPHSTEQLVIYDRTGAMPRLWAPSGRRMTPSCTCLGSLSFFTVSANFLLLFQFLFIDFREREEGRERETWICCSTYVFTGWFLCVSWLGIKPTTLTYWDNTLPNWATWPGHHFLSVGVRGIPNTIQQPNPTDT